MNVEFVSHEDEVRNLFLESTTYLPDNQDVRVISFDNFKLAIDKMMDKAYYYGINQNI